MTHIGQAPFFVNGWALFAHPLFLEQLRVLVQQVEALKQKDPLTYQNKNATKRLFAIKKLAFEIIPMDPARPDFRQGNSLGVDHRHWFRAKFYQQYRLFFRFHAQSKIILYAWVNDDSSLRAYEGDGDAYRVFRKMLDSGRPPDNWQQLISEARHILPES